MSKGRQRSSVAVDARTFERLGVLRAQFGIPAIEAVARGVEMLSIAYQDQPSDGRPQKATGGRRPVPDETVKRALCQLAEELGHRPTAAEWDARSEKPCNSKVVANRFGSDGTWLSAGDELLGGPRHRRSLRVWDDHELLEMLRSWYRRYGDSPTQAGWDAAHPKGPTYKVFYRFGGTWNGALAAAGLPERQKPKSHRVQEGRNRQTVTAGRKDAGPVRWHPDAEVETIGKRNR